VRVQDAPDPLMRKMSCLDELFKGNRMASVAFAAGRRGA
jgi:hypothetical protein